MQDDDVARITPPNFAFNPASRRTLPGAEAPRSNSTGAASWRLQLAPAAGSLVAASATALRVREPETRLAG